MNYFCVLIHGHWGYLCVVISNQQLKMVSNKHSLSLFTFNCRSIKRSLGYVYTLCEDVDLVFIQEHWLLPCELNLLNNIHPEFLAIGKSTVELSSNLLVGSPYGGTAIGYCIGVILLILLR